MRIAQIAPIIETVPPKKYGGTERVVHTLTEELVKRGHDVTLFASGDSQTTAKLVSVYPRALRESGEKNIYGHNVWSLLNVGVAHQLHEQFDIIHDHNSQNNPVSLPLANISSVPVVMTLHGALHDDDIRLFETFANPGLISISKAQRAKAPHLHYVANVYNGLSMTHYPFSYEHKGYLLYVGRISAQKGVHYAIEAANQLDLPLIIAAKLDECDTPYYKEFIEPKLSDRIRWIGEVDETERNELMSHALAFLHPVQWPEPFGLTLIEAMACGAPVIAFAKGSIPEVVADQKSGYVVNNINEMIDAVLKVDKIDRLACRNHALANFSGEKMAEGYEKVYERLLNIHHYTNGSALAHNTSVMKNGQLTIRQPHSKFLYNNPMKLSQQE